MVDVRKLTPPQAAAVVSLHSSAVLSYEEIGLSGHGFAIFEF
jgi:hypothetical protein